MVLVENQGQTRRFLPQITLVYKREHFFERNPVRASLCGETYIKAREEYFSFRTNISRIAKNFPHSCLLQREDSGKFSRCLEDLGVRRRASSRNFSYTHTVRMDRAASGKQFPSARQDSQVNGAGSKRTHAKPPLMCDDFTVEFFSQDQGGIWKKYGVPSAQVRSVCDPDLLNVVALRMHLECEADCIEDARGVDAPLRSTPRSKCSGCAGKISGAVSYVMSSTVVEIERESGMHRSPPPGSIVGVFLRRSSTFATPFVVPQQALE